MAQGTQEPRPRQSCKGDDMTPAIFVLVAVTFGGTVSSSNYPSLHACEEARSIASTGETMEEAKAREDKAQAYAAAHPTNYALGTVTMTMGDAPSDPYLYRLVSFDGQIGRGEFDALNADPGSYLSLRCFLGLLDQPSGREPKSYGGKSKDESEGGNDWLRVRVSEGSNALPIGRQENLERGDTFIRILIAAGTLGLLHALLKRAIAGAASDARRFQDA